MAVQSVGVKRSRTLAYPQQGADIKYGLDNRVWTATKLCPQEFDEGHRQAIVRIEMNADHELVFNVPGWKSVWIGAGEEKTVFLLVDPQNRAFALELLARGTYLEGHLAEGHYFAQLYIPAISNVRWNADSCFDQIFSGQVKVREFVYGDTLAGPGLRRAPIVRPPLGGRVVKWLARRWINWTIAPRYNYFRRLYRDAHEGNVMIELMPLSNPEHKSHYLLPIPWLEEDGHLHLRYYRLTPIDVRAR